MHKKDNKFEVNIASFFAGCGGLDLGFKKAGFNITWANEFDKAIWTTFQMNFPETQLDKRSIVDIKSNEIPGKIHGIIGGPPCQAWSEAGMGRGFNDVRGQVFLEYIRIIEDLQPLFFFAENVSGMLMNKHIKSFESIIKRFEDIGYRINYKLLNAKYYDVPQDRERVIIVGYHEKMKKVYAFPGEHKKLLTLKDAIGGLPEPMPAKEFNKTNGNSLQISNHEYMIGGYSSMYMSRNRVRSWDEQSFTIQAGGRHAPIHPQAPKMKFITHDKRIFVPGKEKLYRRLSVRECARIQTFPDTFIFDYNDITDGYKMIGNAVPVQFAKALAENIMIDIQEFITKEAGYELQHSDHFAVNDPLETHFYKIQKQIEKKYTNRKKPKKIKKKVKK